MAQVRAVRRPYTSRGRVSDAARTEQAPTPQPQRSAPMPPPQPEPTVVTIELPPLHDAVEGDSTEREHPGYGESLEPIEAPVDGTETELTVTEIEADVQAEAARMESKQSTVDYSTWTVAQLAAELKRRSLVSSGSKAELTARLLESDVDLGV